MSTTSRPVWVSRRGTWSARCWRPTQQTDPRLTRSWRKSSSPRVCLAACTSWDLIANSLLYHTIVSESGHFWLRTKKVCNRHAVCNLYKLSMLLCYPGYLPNNLPTSCLTMAPRFDTLYKSEGLHRKPLLEINGETVFLTNLSIEWTYCHVSVSLWCVNSPYKTMMSVISHCWSLNCR